MKKNHIAGHACKIIDECMATRSLRSMLGFSIQPVHKAETEVLIKKPSKTDYKTICFNRSNHRRRRFEVSGSKRKSNQTKKDSDPHSVSDDISG